MNTINKQRRDSNLFEVNKLTKLGINIVLCEIWQQLPLMVRLGIIMAVSEQQNVNLRALKNHLTSVEFKLNGLPLKF